MKFITIPKTRINEQKSAIRHKRRFRIEDVRNDSYPSSASTSRTFNLSYIDEIYGIGNGDNYFDIVILKTNGEKIYFEYECETSRDEVLEELIQKIHEKTDYNG
jgi:hypothetical protein